MVCCWLIEGDGHRDSIMNSQGWNLGRDVWTSAILGWENGRADVERYSRVEKEAILCSGLVQRRSLLF